MIERRFGVLQWITSSHMMFCYRINVMQRVDRQIQCNVFSRLRFNLTVLRRMTVDDCVYLCISQTCHFVRTVSDICSNAHIQHQRTGLWTECRPYRKTFGGLNIQTFNEHSIGTVGIKITTNMYVHLYVCI